ncbi:hypothetical protein IT157_09790 [bacterium]|nr:hypothetical protein [bacterium]
MAFSSAVGQACDTLCVGACLEPGTYYYIITPSGAPGSLTCINNDYTVSLDCVPCIPCPQCDPAALQEGEPCPNYPDLFNGGCTPVGVFTTPIHCGDDVCGTLWQQATNYDYDVYELVLTQADSVEWLVYSNIAASIEILQPMGGCVGTILLAGDAGVKCDTLRASVCLQAGTYWLTVRAGYANVYCDPYTASVRCYPCDPCPECPPGARPEGEPCPMYQTDYYNGGCYSSPPSATPVACGDTICGFSFYHDLPDHDFYELTITSRDTVVWCVEADFPVFAAIYSPDPNCVNLIPWAQGNAPECVPLCLVTCLPPGTYWLYVRPMVPTGAICYPYVASVYCAPCPTGQPCTYPDLDFDPANDACAFTNVTLTCGDTICGEIVLSPDGTPDDDWYVFTIPFGSPCMRLTANVFGNDTPGWFPAGGGLDPAIELVSANCTTQLAADNNSGFGNDALLQYGCLTPGTYHLHVGGAAQTLGPYILALSCGPCPCPPPCPYQNRDFEPANNNCQTVNVEFVCGDTLCGEISPGATPDEDWYMFFVFGPQCEQLTLDIYAHDTPGYFGYLQGLDSYVELYDASCTNQIAFDDNSGVGNDAQMLTACLDPGIYYARVTGVANTFGPYVMFASCQYCACGDSCPYPNLDFDPVNDVCAQANVTVTCGDTLCGELVQSPPPSPFDADWYIVNVPGPGCKSIAVDCFGNDTPGFYSTGGGCDPTLTLYASDCSTLLEFDYDGGVGTDSRLVSGCLQPGAYLLQVSTTTGLAGPYVLSIFCRTCECPCALQCPPSWPAEGEACPNLAGDFYNGGCFTTPPSFTPVTCGSSLCGQSFAMGGMRDTDWYRFSLTTWRRVIWRVRAEFPFEMAIYKELGGCNLQTVCYKTGLACQMKNCFVNCLGPGVYYLYVAPTVYNGVPCKEYTSRLTCGLCLIDDVVIWHANPHIELHWTPNETEPVYEIYRLTEPDIDLDPDYRIGTTLEPMFVDQDVLSSGSEKYFYVVVMQDPPEEE